MRKTIIISSYDDTQNPYYAGGGAIAVHRIAERLTNEYKVIVYTGKYPGSVNLSRDGVVYRRIGSTLFGPKIGQLIYQAALPFLAAFLHYDLWIESFTPPFSTAFLPVFTRKPVMGLVHMLSGEDMQRKYKLPFPVIEKFGLKFYRYIITPSEIYARKMRLINPRCEIRSIPNGVSQMFKNLPCTVTEGPITFIGRIEVNQKGLDLLLQAYKLVASKMPNKLKIVGSGEKSELTKLSVLIDKLGLNSKVEVPGRVEGQARLDAYSKSLFMVLSSRFETFSMVALETLTAGKPFVCFDIEGFSWLPDNCGLKVPCFNIQAFAQAMLKLVTNKELRKKLGEKAKEESKNYSWDKSAAGYKTFISKVLT